jgi:hypothetical protein
MRGTTRRNLFLGLFVLAVIGVSSAAAWEYFARNQLRGGLGEHREVAAPVFPGTLRLEINAFQDRVEALERDPGLQKAKGQDLADLTKRLEEMRRQADRLESRQDREGRMLDLAAQMSSQSVSTSVGMVSFISALFVIVVFGVSLAASLQFKDLKEEFASLRAKIAEFEKSGKDHVEGVATNVKNSKEKMDLELARLNLLTTNLGEQASAGGVFLDSLVNVHAEAFSEILSTLPLGRIFSEEEGHRVRLKGQELQGRLLLLHPDRERRKKAVMLLGAVGTRIAKADLRRLQKDQNTDKDMALLIESAVRKIDEQIGNQVK